jgi:hypothetical protein
MRQFLFAAALGLTALALTAKPAHALRCCDNDSTTPVEVGTGSTCAAAQANLQALVNADVAADCGSLTQSCRFGLTYLDDCYDNPGGGLASQGYESYGCKYFCPPFP